MNKYKIRLSEIILGIFIASLFIYWQTRKKVNFEDFALGKGTSSFYAERNGFPIHLSKFTQNGLSQLKQGWINRGENDILLVLGNSQTHGINHIKKGDMGYNALLFDTLQPIKIDVITHSIPNANLQELLLSYRYLSNDLPIKHLVIPLFMDDLREDGIRDVFFPEVIDRQYSIEDTTLVSLKINRALKVFQETTDNNEVVNGDENMTALNETVQEEIEKLLTEELGTISKSWSGRESLRGSIFTNMYLLRNTVLGIDAQTKRPLIKDRYYHNISAFKSLLEHTKTQNVKVLAYIPPIRNDVEIPYIISEYEDFKLDIGNIVSTYEHVSFVNLESIVLSQYWGTKEATNLLGKEELDFMHFQYAGHKLLYENLLGEIEKIIKE